MATTINGAAYSWDHVVVNIDGIAIDNIKSINYKEDQKIDHVYGAGVRPIGRSYGQITPTASITLALGEVEEIRKKTKTGRLCEIKPFIIIVKYGDGDELEFVTHRLLNVQFKNEGTILDGDKNKESVVSLDLILSEIEWR